MSKLISADITRLFKDKRFLIEAVGVFLFSAYVMLNSVYAYKKYGYGGTLDYKYCAILPYAGLLIAAFVSVFIGLDNSSGMLRSKTAVGNSRASIYFSDLLVSAVGSTVFFAAWAIGGMVGVFFFGFWEQGLKSYLLMLAVSYFSVLVFSAVFCALGHLLNSLSSGAVAAIFLSLMFLYAGAILYNSLEEPETTYEYVRVSDEEVEYGDEIPNPAYVGGSKRKLYETMMNIVPTGQQIRIAVDPTDLSGKESAVMIAISAADIIVFTAAGYLLFRKKDLK